MRANPSATTPKTVLITGCSSGFGKRLVHDFLNDGWRVIATMRQAEARADMFSEEARRFGNNLVIAELDVTSSNDRDAIVEKITNLDNPTLDCLVNNAGYALFGALENCTEAQLRQQHEVNLIAPMLLTRALLPFLRKSKGAVINVSSIMSFVGFPLSSAYCSSKAGLTMLSEALKYELDPVGVRIHSVEPGGFRTGFVNNSQWGSNDTLAYERQTKGFQKLQDKLNSGEGKDPAPVIQKIVSLANSKDRALRKQVGNDALISKIMHKSLPESLRLKAMGIMFKRILQ
ncbi:hypothetical protein A9Q99_00225 [Gammaproteobacteria bacterium 45_16_T64]|nr:hypothetical protein A9Q99_00225 [Gammaproteobacteria bacterium 45_16_T64]